MNFFSVHNIAFSVAGYDLSWLEFIGTIFNLASVWLMARNRIATWPVGIVGVVLFFLLFWQIRLYADMFEQIYYFLTGFWGWWLWRKQSAREGEIVRRNSTRENLVTFLLTLVLSMFAGYVIANLDVWSPRLFPEAASFAYLDATTTIASFTAQILMARRRIECWILWIAIDVVGVALYWEKRTVFLSALYLVFLVLAIVGLLTWNRHAKSQRREVAAA
jgi:nicotinamide mononucleotide transporter